MALSYPGGCILKHFGALHGHCFLQFSLVFGRLFDNAMGLYQVFVLVAFPQSPIPVYTSFERVKKCKRYYRGGDHYARCPVRDKIPLYVKGQR